jgi:hypothetical protein
MQRHRGVRTGHTHLHKGAADGDAIECIRNRGRVPAGFYDDARSLRQVEPGRIWGGLVGAGSQGGVTAYRVWFHHLDAAGAAWRATAAISRPIDPAP